MKAVFSYLKKILTPPACCQTSSLLRVKKLLDYRMLNTRSLTDELKPCSQINKMSVCVRDLPQQDFCVTINTIKLSFIWTWSESLKRISVASLHALTLSSRGRQKTHVAHYSLQVSSTRSCDPHGDIQELHIIFSRLQYTRWIRSHICSASHHHTVLTSSDEYVSSMNKEFICKDIQLR